MPDVETLALAVYGLLGCAGALLVYFAVIADRWKEELKYALLILVSYFIFELVSLQALSIVFRSLTLGVPADSVRVLSVFFVSPLLCALFILICVATGKKSRRTEEGLKEKVARYAQYNDNQLSNFEKKTMLAMDAGFRRIEDRFENSIATSSTEVLTKLIEMKDSINERLVDLSIILERTAAAPSRSSQINIAQTEGPKQSEEQAQEVLIDPDVYERVRRMISRPCENWGKAKSAKK